MRTTVTCRYSRTCNYHILVLTIYKEEQLVLKYRATKGYAISRIMRIGDRQIYITHLATLKMRVGKIGIYRTLVSIGTTLGHSINATASKSALTNIVWSDRYRHLVESIDRNRCTTTRQRTWLHAKRVVERSTIDGNTRLTVVSTTNSHTAGRARLWSHLHDIKHGATNGRYR